MNPNHTHFLLIDDGDDEGANRFRMNFLTELKNSKKYIYKSKLVNISIEGGFGTLKYIWFVLKNKLHPIILLKVTIF